MGQRGPQQGGGWPGGKGHAQALLHAARGGGQRRSHSGGHHGVGAIGEGAAPRPGAAARAAVLGRQGG